MFVWVPAECTPESADTHHFIAGSRSFSAIYMSFDSVVDIKMLNKLLYDNSSTSRQKGLIVYTNGW